MTEVNLKDLETNDKSTKTTHKKEKLHPLNNPPKITRHEQVEDKFNGYFYGVIPDELKGGLKSLLFYGMSMPAPKHKRRRMLMNLHQSRYTEQYMNKYLHIDMLSGLDDHTKLLLVYGMNYLDAFMSVDEMPVMEKAKTQEQKNAPPQQENNI